MKRVILCGLVAAAGAASTTVLADDDTGAFYVAPMGQYNLLDTHRASADGFGFDVALGYNIAPHFAAEFNGSNGSYQIHKMESQKLTAYTLDAMYKILPGGIIDPYAIIGGGEMDDTVGAGNPTYKTWTAEAGLGALTGLGPQTGSFRVLLRTEAKYRREFVQNVDFNPKNPGDVLFNVGVQFEFGAPLPPPPPVVAAAPPPPPPPAPPPPPPPPPPPAPRRVKFSADALFAFNKSTIRSEGTGDIDKFATELKGTTYEHIDVYGYTDRFGSDEYNLKLSQERADSVKEYLVSKDGLDGSKIDTHGLGKADPVTSSTECGMKKSAKTIACLQPDRRVELEVLGNKRR